MLERHGKTVAAMVCIEDLEFLERVDARDDAEALAELGADKSVREKAEGASL